VLQVWGSSSNAVSAAGVEVQLQPVVASKMEEKKKKSKILKLAELAVVLLRTNDSSPAAVGDAAGAVVEDSTAEVLLAVAVPDRMMNEIREAAAVVDAVADAVKKKGWSYCAACVLAAADAAAAAAAVRGTARLRKRRNRKGVMFAASDASLSLQHNVSIHLRNNQTCSKRKEETKEEKLM
jgi:hypothetical protein